MAIPNKTQPKDIGGFKGKQARMSNSLGLPFEKALFQSHPEFSGNVRARIIAPGRMLVIAEPAVKPQRARDPVMEAFLTFLVADMECRPQQMKPLNQELAARVDALIGRVSVNPHEDLSDEPLV